MSHKLTYRDYPVTLILRKEGAWIHSYPIFNYTFTVIQLVCLTFTFKPIFTNSHTYLKHYSSDAAIKQYIKFLDEHNLLGKKFILHDLDDVHLFVAGDVAHKLQEKLDELMERNSYSEFGQEVQGQRVRKE